MKGLSVTLATATAGGTIAAVRSLGARGADVSVVSSQTLGAAAWSRFAKHTYSAPPENDSERFVERLLAIGAANPGRILLPTSDETAWTYSENASRLQQYFHLYHPPIASLRRILDKKLFSNAAQSTGLSVLPTWDPANFEELKDQAKSMTFPVLIKPRTHVHRIRNDKGLLVHSFDELIQQYHRFVDRELGRAAESPFLPDGKRPIIQKFVRVGAEGVLSITGFVDRTGELFVTRAARKVFTRSQPVGVGVCFEAQPAPEGLPTLVRQLCRELGYFGLFEVEFLRSEDQWAVIDFNPRLFSQVGLDIRRGMPLPLLACLDAVKDTASLRDEIAKAQDKDDGQAVFCDRFTLRAILLAQTLTNRISERELSKWRAWMKEHAANAVDFAADSSDRMPEIIHAFSEVYLGLKSLPRFLRSKPSTVPAPGSQSQKRR